MYYASCYKAFGSFFRDSMIFTQWLLNNYVQDYNDTISGLIQTEKEFHSRMADLIVSMETDYHELRGILSGIKDMATQVSALALSVGVESAFYSSLLSDIEDNIDSLFSGITPQSQKKSFHFVQNSKIRDLTESIIPQYDVIGIAIAEYFDGEESIDNIVLLLNNRKATTDTAINIMRMDRTENKLSGSEFYSVWAKQSLQKVIRNTTQNYINSHSGNELRDLCVIDESNLLIDMRERFFRYMESV